MHWAESVSAIFNFGRRNCNSPFIFYPVQSRSVRAAQSRIRRLIPRHSHFSSCGSISPNSDRVPDLLPTRSPPFAHCVAEGSRSVHAMAINPSMRMDGESRIAFNAGSSRSALWYTLAMVRSAATMVEPYFSKYRCCVDRLSAAFCITDSSNALSRLSLRFHEQSRKFKEI